MLLFVRVGWLLIGGMETGGCMAVNGCGCQNRAVTGCGVMTSRCTGLSHLTQVVILITWAEFRKHYNCCEGMPASHTSKLARLPANASSSRRNQTMGLLLTNNPK